MLLIDTTYFNGKINVPNVDNPVARGSLAQFISEYEPDFLRKLLGPSLYAAYITGIAIVAPDQKWLDLRDGTSYNYGGNTYTWKGLTQAITAGTVTYKFSPIANYIWYWWMRTNNTSTTSEGESSSKKANGNKVSPALKMATVWNVMAEWNRTFYQFLQASTDTYPEWEGHQYYLDGNGRPNCDLVTTINEFNL